MKPAFRDFAKYKAMLDIADRHSGSIPECAAFAAKLRAFMKGEGADRPQDVHDLGKAAVAALKGEPVLRGQRLLQEVSRAFTRGGRR